MRTPRRLWLCALAFLLSIVGLTVASPAEAATLGFTSVADTYVTAANPTAANGTAANARVAGDPEKIAYFKFNVSGVPTGATVTGATLSLTGVGTQAAHTVTVKNVGNAWTEATTYNTRPALGSVVGSGTMNTGVTLAVEVPVSGNGTVSFAVTSSVAADSVIATSENGTAGNRPSLDVEYSTAPPPPSAACADGVDNDSDGKVDYPTDPGCASSTDDDETDAVTPPPPPPPTGGPFLPYSADSFLKSRVDVTGVPVDSTRTQQFYDFMASNPDQAPFTYPKINMNPDWSGDYDYGTAADPVWKLTGGNTSDPKLQILATQGVHISQAVINRLPTGTQDRPLFITDEVFGYSVQFADAVPNNTAHTISVSNAGIMWHSSNGLDYRNPQSDDERNVMSRGRLPEAMRVTREELDAAMENGTGVGHVLHWFFVETNGQATPCFFHPMVGCEGKQSGWGEEGLRLRIKPSVDLAARGLTGAALALARTMQENGAYLGDNSGSATQIKVGHPDNFVGTNLATNVFSGKITWQDFQVIQPGWQ